LIGARFVAADPINPYITVGILYDDNLLRLANDEAAEKIINSTDTSDTKYSAEIGFDSLLRIKRQRVLLSAAVNENKYSEFNELDHTGGHANVLLNWEVGRNWNGRTGFLYDRTITDLDNIQRLLRDLKTRNRFLLEATRQLSPRWFFDLGTSYTDVDFSERSNVNKETIESTARGRYVSRADNEFGFEIKFADGDFPDRDEDDPSFTKTEATGFISRSINRRSSIYLRGGFADRDESSNTRSGFDGAIGQIDYYWKPSGKLSFKTSASRDLSTLNDEIQDFLVIEKFSFGPTWNVTSKLQLDAYIDIENRDGQGGGVEQSSGQPPRKDDLTTVGMGVNYTKSKNLTAYLNLESGERKSNQDGRGYDYNEIVLNIKFNL